MTEVISMALYKITNYSVPNSCSDRCPVANTALMDLFHNKRKCLAAGSRTGCPFLKQLTALGRPFSKHAHIERGDEKVFFHIDSKNMPTHFQIYLPEQTPESELY